MNDALAKAPAAQISAQRRIEKFSTFKLYQFKSVREHRCSRTCQIRYIWGNYKLYFSQLLPSTAKTQLCVSLRQWNGNFSKSHNFYLQWSGGIMQKRTAKWDYFACARRDISVRLRTLEQKWTTIELVLLQMTKCQHLSILLLLLRNGKHFRSLHNHNNRIRLLGNMSIYTRTLYMKSVLFYWFFNWVSLALTARLVLPTTATLHTRLRVFPSNCPP